MLILTLRSMDAVCPHTPPIPCPGTAHLSLDYGVSTATSCLSTRRHVLLVRPSLVYATSRSSLVSRPFLSSYKSRHLETDVVSQRDNVSNKPTISHHNDSTNIIWASAKNVAYPSRADNPTLRRRKSRAARLVCRELTLLPSKFRAKVFRILDLASSCGGPRSGNDTFAYEAVRGMGPTWRMYALDLTPRCWRIS